MKPQNLHAQEDRLLDFVYGELPPMEARAVESHLEGCTRCSELLADIRGVRTTMAQLPMEPAPDAGLESLLAYAQQAARNAAAGPAPKPTWWRRWLVPIAGVAAVSLFGIVSLKVSRSVDLSPQLSVQTESVRSEHSAAKDEKAAEAYNPPAPATPAPVAQAAPTGASSPSLADAAPAQAQEENAAGAVVGSARNLEGMTPPAAYPPAKLDKALMAKEIPHKKAFVAGTRGANADFGNAGAGAGFERAKEADKLAAAEKKSTNNIKDSEYYRRDAMTQVGALTKAKQGKLSSLKDDEYEQMLSPEPAAAPSKPVDQPAERQTHGGADEMLAEAPIQQQAPAQGSLRIGGGRANSTTANKPMTANSSEDLDDVMGNAKTSLARREQEAPNSVASPPPPPPAAALPKPTVAATTPSAPPAYPTRAEVKGKLEAPPSSDLSQQAEAALRAGDRFREAQLLVQALNAGATGSERLGLLNRLCDAQFAIGQRQDAIKTCSLVLEEGPRSGAAQVARSRLRREAPESDAAEAGPGSRGPLKAAPAEKRSAPSSVDSAHAQ